MVTFLLWNIHGKDLTGPVVQFVEEHCVDVVMLIEANSLSPHSLLMFLNQTRVGAFVLAHASPRFCVLSNQKSLLTTLPLLGPATGGRLLAWRLQLVDAPEVLLSLVHGPALPSGAGKQGLFFEQVRAELEYLEERVVKHRRTLLSGDFNANPFDSIVGGFRNLHAVRMKTVNGRTDRSCQGRDSRFFYNFSTSILLLLRLQGA